MISNNIIKHNQNMVYVYMTIITLGLGFLGHVLSTHFNWGLTGTGCFLIAAGFLNFIAYFFSDILVIKTSKATPIKENDIPEYYQIVSELCAKNNIKTPRLYLLNDSSINAFATGRNTDKAIIAITKGALEKLTPDEIKGVVGHELSHIESNDIRLMAIISILAGIISIIADMFWHSTAIEKVSEKDESGITSIIGYILSIIAPLTVFLIKLAISRHREYIADARGAELCGNPMFLADALSKIKNDRIPLRNASSATAHLYIATPFKFQGDFIENLMSTHPDINDRIEKLRNMTLK